MLNCILVNENVRPAMLVQPEDYEEASHHDPKTKYIIGEITKMFPHLLASSDYETYQGVIISKTDYNGKKDISLEEMGKLLGYPCYKDFDTMEDNNDKVSYSISIYAEDNKNNRIQLFANRCKDAAKIQEFNTIAGNARTVFAKKEYNEILREFQVKEVYVEKVANVPTQAIINKLVKNEKLEENEIDTIQNILYNFGFSTELQLFFCVGFQYNNPIHKGILLDLLLKEKHDTLSPFYPLQKYPVESKKVYEITAGFEKDLMKILRETQIQTQAQSVESTFYEIKRVLFG
jgi:hypothetical protein